VKTLARMALAGAETDAPLAPIRTESISALIARQPFFKGLAAEHLDTLAESAMEMEFVAGQSIFDEGSPANRFYLILEGRVVLESEVKEHECLPIRVLGRGDALGWAWLVPPNLLHFSARALEPTRTIFFYGTRLREQCGQDHELGYQLLTRVMEVVVQNLNAIQERLVECADPAKFSNPRLSALLKA